MVDCHLQPESVLVILSPIASVLVIGAIGGWLGLRSTEYVDSDGRGLFKLWSHEHPLVRRMAKAAIVGAVGMFVLYIAIDRSVWLYRIVTDFVNTCASVPALWTPSIIFTAAFLVLPVVGLFVTVPKLWSVVWALFTLAIGFHLSTWNAPTFAIVWIPATLAALPIVVALLRDAVGQKNGQATSQPEPVERFDS